MHAATINENLRRNSEIPDAFPSLWTLKHAVERGDPHAEPVLLKASRWLLQYLPTKVIAESLSSLLDVMLVLLLLCLLRTNGTRTSGSPT
jgi:hypothetical protein